MANKTEVRLTRDETKHTYLYHSPNETTFIVWKEMDRESDWYGWWCWDVADFLAAPDGEAYWCARNSGDYMPKRLLADIRSALAGMEQAGEIPEPDFYDGGGFVFVASF